MRFDEFVDAEISALTRFAGVLTGDRQLAHDVLTDALLVAAARWTRIAAMDHPAAYVRRIVTTTYLADRRKASRRRTDVTDVIDGRPSPDIADRVGVRRDLDELIRQLPPQQRAAVVTRFYLDWPDDDIAVALGCSPATVRSHLSHAMTALRALSASTKDER